MTVSTPLSQRRIFFFWLPLAATWLMMSLEGPFLAAVIARMDHPKYNLAAYGVAFAFAMLMESPVIMIMTASTALVKDRDSLRTLGRFTLWLNAAVTLLMALFILPPVFDSVVRGLVGLGDPVATLAHGACVLLLPWPAAIGYRRFFQGVLIRSGLTRRVAYGTVVRMGSMGITAMALAVWGRLPGALVGAASLSAGVILEALASRLMAAGAVRRLLAGPGTPEREEPLTLRGISSFYFPLALTTVLMLGVNPLVTFFLGRSRLALESLAVMPVVNSLAFLFGSAGLALQETVVALLGPGWEGRIPLRRFGTVLGISLVGAFVLLGNTPLLDVWLGGVAGLDGDLRTVASVPIRILGVMPGLSVLICWQRAVLVSSRRTAPMTWATLVEVGGIATGLYLGVEAFGWVGATAAASAILAARFAANVFLQFPVGKVGPRREGR
jgi:hypothetical protein